MSKNSDQSPQVAGDPHAELGQLIERSIALQDEALKANKRMKELNEQIAQRHQISSAERELRSRSTNGG